MRDEPSGDAAADVRGPRLVDGSDVRAAKRAMRRAIAARLGALAPFVRARRAERAAALALRSPALAGARLVLAYRALPDEIDCDALVAMLAARGVRIAFPSVVFDRRTAGARKASARQARLGTNEAGARVAPSRLAILEVLGSDPLAADCWTTDRFGVRAPRTDHPCVRQRSPREIDAVIVPGRAFDGSGARLGRGGGFYDRLLAALRPDARRASLGFAFEEQFVSAGRRPARAPDGSAGDAERDGLSDAVAADVRVPCETHDVRVAAIATDRTIRRARR